MQLQREKTEKNNFFPIHQAELHPFMEVLVGTEPSFYWNVWDRHEIGHVAWKNLPFLQKLGFYFKSKKMVISVLWKDKDPNSGTVKVQTGCWTRTKTAWRSEWRESYWNVLLHAEFYFTTTFLLLAMVIGLIMLSVAWRCSFGLYVAGSHCSTAALCISDWTLRQEALRRIWNEDGTTRIGRGSAECWFNENLALPLWKE